VNVHRDTINTCYQSSECNAQSKLSESSATVGMLDVVRLNEPPARIAIGERRFSHYAPHIWNSLPTTVRSADSYDSFKARLKTHLFNTVGRWRT